MGGRCSNRADALICVNVANIVGDALLASTKLGTFQNLFVIVFLLYFADWLYSNPTSTQMVVLDNRLVSTFDRSLG